MLLDESWFYFLFGLYRVTFYTREGVFLTTYVDAVDRDYRLVNGTEEAKAAIAALRWLDEAEETDGFVLLSLHNDILPAARPVSVYGVSMRLSYLGNPIGYLEVTNLGENAARILKYLDDDNVTLEMIFDDGDRLYANGEVTWTWPDTLEEGRLTTVNVEKGSRTVYYSRINSLGLRLYISQDSAVITENNANLRWSMFRRALYILLPTLDPRLPGSPGHRRVLPGRRHHLVCVFAADAGLPVVPAHQRGQLGRR